MYCVAKYCGKNEKLGVKPGEIHTVELNIYSTDHGAPYLWVRAADGAEYMMPFTSMHAMLKEWLFAKSGDDAERQEKAERIWLGMYYPEESAVKG